MEVLREKRAETLLAESSEGRPVVPTGDSVGSTGDEKVLPLEECLDTFWQAGEALSSFVARPTTPEVENAILKRLGDAPFTEEGQNITLLLSKVYSLSSVAALRKASGELMD